MKKIEYINYLKALAIIAVVIGHSKSPLVKYVYLYHIPLFFFISGYLYNRNYDFKTLLFKRLKGLYVPFVSYSIIFIVLHNLFYRLKIYDTPYEFNNEWFITNIKSILMFDNIDVLLSGFWFLKALFLITISFAFLNFLLKKYKRRESILIIVIVLLFTYGNYILTRGNVTEHPYFNKICMNMIVFYFGYKYREYESKILVNFTGAVICTILLYSNSLYSSIDVSYNSYNSSGFFLVCVLCGIYLNIFLAKYIARLNKNFIFTRVLSYIGKNTIIILALHLVAFKLVMLLQIKIYNLSIDRLTDFPFIQMDGLWWVLYTIIGIFVPLAINVGLNKCKLFFNKILIANKKGSRLIESK